MSSKKRQVKRITPIIKVNKALVDNRAAELADVRRQKATVQRELQENQRRYMEGVEQLNRVRGSDERNFLHTLEHGLDYVKSQWYASYKRLQESERLESLAIQALTLAQRKLKAIENLQEKYELGVREEERIIEQKQIDEVALRKFSNAHSKNT